MLMTIIYAALMALICLRLITYRRGDQQYRLLPSLLAYVLALVAASAPINVIFGHMPEPDISAIVLAAVVLVALCDAGGSAARLLPKRRPRTKKTPSASDIMRRYLP